MWHIFVAFFFEALNMLYLYTVFTCWPTSVFFLFALLTWPYSNKHEVRTFYLPLYKLGAFFCVMLRKHGEGYVILTWWLTILLPFFILLFRTYFQEHVIWVLHCAFYYVKLVCFLVNTEMPFRTLYHMDGVTDVDIDYWFFIDLWTIILISGMMSTLYLLLCRVWGCKPEVLCCWLLQSQVGL